MSVWLLVSVSVLVVCGAVTGIAGRRPWVSDVASGSVVAEFEVMMSGKAPRPVHRSAASVLSSLAARVAPVWARATSRPGPTDALEQASARKA